MLSVLYKLNWFFKMHWKRYSVALSLLVIASAMEMVPPMLIGTAIDAIAYGELTRDTLLLMIVGFSILIIVIYVISYIWHYMLFGGSFLIERILRKRFMRHLLRMTPRFYEHNRTGDLMARATNDLGAIATTTGYGILTLIDSSVFFSVIILTMGFLISWPLTLAALLPLPILAYVIMKLGGLIHDRFTTAQNAFGTLNDQVLESISGIRVIRAYVREKADLNHFDQVTEDVFKKNINVSKIDVLFEPITKIIVGVSYLIGIGYGSYLVFHSKITLGDLIAFNVYLGMLIWPMFAIGELINIMQRGNASLDRVNETLGSKSEVVETEHPAQLDVPAGIRFEHVTFRYPSSQQDNLKDISFQLKKGETLGVVGRTGSGKTTLFKQLLRQYAFGQGTIMLGDTPLGEISIDQLKQWIGYVPQEQTLFSRSIRDNIVLGVPESDDHTVEQALKLADFQKDITFLPDGLSTMVGERGVALSGGQKQRISIARALIMDPEILILDDAMSAVDARTEAKIIDNIRSEREGKTTLISSHRLSAVMHAEWIIVIDEGQIIQAGTHEALVRVDGWYKEQFERQQLEAQLSESR